ncbi:MAG: DUF2723 domain-containing protein [bacterium]|nr:DUF2723 domain-containing protein [bacterium]
MNKNTLEKILLFIISLIIGSIYIYYQSVSIYGGDGGELVTAMVTNGIPHPPGFPLYTFLGSLLVKYIPFFSPAWKASLLSSIPSLITKVVFFLLLKKLTKSSFFSFIGTLLYAFLYPIWLFSEVPEVISVLNLGIISCLYLIISYYQKKDIRKLYIFALIFSLTLFHNYIILLITPGIFYLLVKKKDLKLLIRKNVLFTFFFLIGSIPYAYFFIISRNYPPLDYEHPVNLMSLIKLITRGSYGTFNLSGSSFFNPISGLNNILQFFIFTLRDIKIVGAVLVVLGFFELKRRNKVLFTFFLISIFFSIFFFFYASFPLVLEFHLGTFEKFLVIPYIFIVIGITFGLIYVSSYFPALIKNIYLKLTIYRIILIFSILYVAIIFINGYQKISILKNDITAENLGRDLLESVPKNGIISLDSDTALYNSLYVHYVLGVRPDIKIIRYDFLQQQEYRDFVHKAYPDILLPKVYLDQAQYLKNFFEINGSTHSIMYPQPIPSVPETWLPHGLLWKYYPKNTKLPSQNELISQNLTLWQKFHSPYMGSLRVRRNFLLADVLRVYGRGHESLGLTFLEAKKYDYAESEFKQLIDYVPYNPDAYIALARVLIKQNKCKEAEKDLNISLNIDKNHLDTYKYMIDLYGNCYNNSEKAEEYSQLYLQKKKEQSTKASS